MQYTAYKDYENVTKKIVLSFLAPKISIIFSIFSPTTRLVYFCSILSLWVYACVCSIVCTRIFMFFGWIFSLFVLPEFSLNLPKFPPKFTWIQGGNFPPWPPISYAYVPSCTANFDLPNLHKKKKHFYFILWSYNVLSMFWSRSKTEVKICTFVCSIVSDSSVLFRDFKNFQKYFNRPLLKIVAFLNVKFSWCAVWHLHTLSAVIDVLGDPNECYFFL